MKRFLLAAVAFLLFMTFNTVSYAKDKELNSFQPSSQEKQRVIVTFKDKANKSTITNADGKISKEFKNIPVMSALVPKSAIKGLEKNPNIASVEIDPVVNIKSQYQDWGITRTEAPKAWQSDFTGKGVKIAVLDTGIAEHEDLTLAGGVSFTSYTSSYTDDNGHGTHVAGIIGAKNNEIGTVGIAPDASIYAVKVLSEDGSGYLSDLIAGIDWAITNKMDIINLSLGLENDSDSFKEIIDKAYAQGILVVASAGNDGNMDGTGDNVDYPARYDSVIAVAATDISDQRVYYSSTGNTIEVAAPGERIISTYLNNQYATLSGTSMAAPFVSGNLALLKQAYPGLSAEELRKKLQESVADLGTPGKDDWFGYGLIKAPITKESESSPENSVNEEAKVNVALSTNKSTFFTGEKVLINAKVTDEKGNLISGASLKIKVIQPSGKTVTKNILTNSQGEVAAIYQTKRKNATGTYKINVVATYLNSTGTTETAFLVDKVTERTRFNMNLHKNRME